MKSLLDALQDGRLVELPTNDKNDVLEYLALLLEAIPDIHSDIDIVEEILKREKEGNTGLGKGIAIPHLRAKHEGEMLCAVGWSPEGIDYGAPDGKRVHIVIMYFVPDSARATYLKELSSLAKAVLKSSGDILSNELSDIHDVRSKLLDWVEMSVNETLPDVTARMIRLEQKQAAKEAAVLASVEKQPFSVIPFTFITFESGESKILAQDKEFVERFERSAELAKITAANNALLMEGYYVKVTSSQNYFPNRVLHTCIAIKQE